MFSGPGVAGYAEPSHRLSATARTIPEKRLRSGRRSSASGGLGWIAANSRGISPPRPREKIARVAAVAPELALATAAVEDRERDEQAADPGQDLFGHAAPGIALVERMNPVMFVRAEEHGRRVVAERVEDPDPDAGVDHRLPDRSFRVAGLLAERRRGFEADEREEAEDHALERRPQALRARNEDRQRVSLRRR